MPRNRAFPFSVAGHGTPAGRKRPGSGKDEMEEKTESKNPEAGQDRQKTGSLPQAGRRRGKNGHSHIPSRGRIPGRSRGSKSRGERRAPGCLVRLVLAFILAAVFFGIGYETGKNAGDGGASFVPETRKYVDLSAVKAPDWISQEFIDVNKYSRPGIKLNQVNNIVVHYVANPGTTAEQNRSYFAGLANQTGSSKIHASCHFIIGLDGEIVQIIPIDEMAYASNNRNSDTIAIECCHPGEDGKFSDATYASLVKLSAWLCGELDLTQKDLIRHYDVNGKICPKYFVEHEDAWKDFKNDVKKALNE